MTLESSLITVTAQGISVIGRTCHTRTHWQTLRRGDIATESSLALDLLLEHGAVWAACCAARPTPGVAMHHAFVDTAID